GLLMLSPTWNIIHHRKEQIHVTGFTVTLAASVAALAIWLLLRRGRWRPWVGFASSAFDVSMVTTALVSFLVVANPLVALVPRVTGDGYCVPLVAASLRYDAGVSIAAGALTLTQYGGLWLWSALQYNLYGPACDAIAGPYDPLDLSTRLILLAIATIL